MDPYTIAQFLKFWVCLRHLDQNGLTLLQVIVGLLQFLAMLALIPFTLRAARRGAERAYELERRRAREERERQEESLRVLIGLEFELNAEELQRLRSRLRDVVGDEEYKVSEVGVERARVYEWLKQRQVFAARYMPAWSHRAWYGQQTSPLLLGALTVSEIVVISDFHSLLDRLTRTSEFLSGRLGQLEKLREKITDRMTQWSWERANAENDGRLWNSLLGDLQKAADMENPLRAAIDRHALGYEVGQAAAQH